MTRPAAQASRPGTQAPQSGPAALRLRVIGSGPVALAFAAFARRQGVRADAIAIARADAPTPPALAARVLALSLGSWQLLARIARMPAAAPIEAVDVAVSGLPGRTRITARELGVPALGHVVRYGALLDALARAVAGLGVVARADEAGADAHEPALVVHAEGDTGEGASELAFEQSALLAEVRSEPDAPPGAAGTAFERFADHGPLALLPLPEPRRHALVWCDLPAETERRAALPPQALAAELQQAFGWRIGRLSIAGPASVALLVRRARRDLVAGREAWIGNAAQALHPVAGQGLNLGIRDAFLLARCVGDALDAGTDAAPALARYARERRIDRNGTIAVTDALARVFSVRPLRPLQSLTLTALDLLPPAREGLARQFMFGLR